jgi:hypothetical protein
MNGSNLNSERLSIPAEFICPQCKKSLKVVTHFQAIMVVCNGCKSIINNRTKVTVGKINKQAKLIIPIGSKGRIKDTLYQVVGYIKFREYKTIYTWNEYTLFNPVYGYAFISEYNGHWTFTEQSYIYPLSSYRSFEFLQQTFNQFNEYKSSIEYAEGEFNWDILQCEKSNVEEFIAPPYMLSKETTDKELLWFKSEYIQASEITKAFKLLQGKLPFRTGVGVLQTSSFDGIKPLVKKFTYRSLIVLCVLHLLLILHAPDKIVYNNSFNLDSLKPLATPSFKLEGSLLGTDNLEFNLGAPVDNSWFEAGITLVNDDTGEEYSFEQGIEYYHGYDWSEGSRKDSKVLSSIPDGTYHLNISPFMDTHAVPYFSIEVVKGVSVWSNFFIILICLLIYPILLGIRKNYFEHQRWQSSKYSD